MLTRTIAGSIRSGPASIQIRGRFWTLEWSRADIEVNPPDLETGERSVTVRVPNEKPEVYPLNRVISWQPLSE